MVLGKAENNQTRIPAEKLLDEDRTPFPDPVYTMVWHSVQAIPAGVLRTTWTEPRPTIASCLRRGKTSYGRCTAITDKTNKKLSLDFRRPLMEASATPVRSPNVIEGRYLTTSPSESENCLLP